MYKYKDKYWLARLILYHVENVKYLEVLPDQVKSMFIK